jgi:hypothetical protein
MAHPFEEKKITIVKITMIKLGSQKYDYVHWYSLIIYEY